EERGDLLLPALHRQQDDEIKDRQDECKGHQMHPRTRPPLRWGSHGNQERRGHESSDRREADRRNSCLNLSKVRSDIASLILCIVSRKKVSLCNVLRGPAVVFTA